MPQPKNYTIHYRNITVFQTENKAPCVWLNTFAQEAESVWNACQELNAPPFTLAAIQINDWNSALSPWIAPAIFKGEAAFAGQGSTYLRELTGCIIPEVTELLSLKPLYHAIAGYSLAGLFAIWSLYQTDLFQRAVSASGSFWYPGFQEYAEVHDQLRQPDAVYFSLGDREHHTRNPLMATVQDRTQALHDHFMRQQVQTTFERNPGNHFQEPALRMAKGIKWMLEQ